MRQLRAAVELGLLDMRGDLRRFALLVVCLAVGTALIAGVGTVGASIRKAIDQNAAVIVGGDLELSRTDRPATPEELRIIGSLGDVATTIDTNVRGTSDAGDAFVDLVAVGESYPLVGRVESDGLDASESPFEFLSLRNGVYGALLDPLMLDKLGVELGDTIELAGTPFEARGTLISLPDGAVRGFRLGQPALISTVGFATLSDTTSPLPGLGTYFRYKVLSETMDAEQLAAQVTALLGDTGWTLRTPRDALGTMVRYYDVFMRFLVVVGLASMLVGGVSVWTVISAYVSERATVIAVMRSIGASRQRILLHFLSQVATLALVGIGVGLLMGGGIGLLALPAVSRAIGVVMQPEFHQQPLLIAGASGILTAFAFSYLPLQQALNIEPIILFRSKGLASPQFRWRSIFASGQIVPVIVAAALFVALANVMTNDVKLVAAFLIVSALSVVLFRLATSLLIAILRRLPESENPIIRRALRGITDPDSAAPSVVTSVGMAVAMLVFVLTLQTNLSNEYLGASVFDVPTFVASDLFSDEAEALKALQAEDADIMDFTVTPMLRGAVTSVAGVSAEAVEARGQEALFLLSGDVPLTFRAQLPPTSRLVEGAWWPANYSGGPLVSLHASLRSGLGLTLGDEISFDVFGDTITAKIANFRDYSWQGGIDFLVAFSPSVLEAYPATLLGAVKAVAGREDAVERKLAAALPEVRFVAIGETLEKVTLALSQLTLAATLVGGLAVGNGFLVLIGSLATGRQQRHADALITKVLGAQQREIVGAYAVQYVVLALVAAILATLIGLALAWSVSLSLLTVDFAVNFWMPPAVIAASVTAVAALGAGSVTSAFRGPPGRLLRALQS
jgi:putative ABC transport system permease protein